MKPRVGRTVYCIYGNSILVEKVGYVGADSFIIESIWDCAKDDCVEWFYTDYEIEWFTSLANAKKVLISKYCGDCKVCKPRIEKAGINWYEIECCN